MKVRLMETNKHISKKSLMYKKGQALIKAAHEYWTEYQKECGSAAVVWLDNDNGHFILFTRSEYKSEILSRASFCQDYPVMERPFEQRKTK